VSLSYSRKGKFEDNPEMESFFGRFKDEWKKVIFEAQEEKEVRAMFSFRYIGDTLKMDAW